MLNDSQKQNWNKIGFYVKLNSISGGTAQQDGILQYWINDVQIMDFRNVVLRTGQWPNMKFNQALLKPYMGPGPPINQTIWYDDLTIATAP